MTGMRAGDSAVVRAVQWCVDNVTTCCPPRLTTTLRSCIKMAIHHPTFSQSRRLSPSRIHHGSDGVSTLDPLPVDHSPHLAINSPRQRAWSHSFLFPRSYPRRSRSRTLEVTMLPPLPLRNLRYLQPSTSDSIFPSSRQSSPCHSRFLYFVLPIAAICYAHAPRHLLQYVHQSLPTRRPRRTSSALDRLL